MPGEVGVFKVGGRKGAGRHDDDFWRALPGGEREKALPVLIEKSTEAPHPAVTEFGGQDA